MHNDSICFIGGGNMAASIIGGLVADGRAPEGIIVADPSAEALAGLAARWPGLRTTQDNHAAAADAGILVLAVKPQVIRAVTEDLLPTVARMRPLIVSIAAGVRAGDIDRWLGGGHAIVRCMPNTPALVRSGASGLYANLAVTESQRNAAERILRAVGLTLWVGNEAQLDAVTAVSGSGPAYFFYVMEAMQAAGEKLGLAPEQARLLVLETAFGAAKLALESTDDAATLRARVTSPGGTTEQAIRTLESGGLMTLFEQALAAAADRARELGDELGKD
ncbi:MAG: pyrroline-5-carboxylate reductase [Gammaproteobacteria bacterium]|nr:pyrroline-5-carboxylate reductase [Gammaproteobacteria bacterium]MDX5375305.1 pyrroline-5-carboxylate reductase [Gammaproteobacteria bacterium]